MHLLEAAMMWEGHDAGGGWDALADEIVDLALARWATAVEAAEGRSE
jgi:mannose/cellobiose epimerase-like protein (N-acyl-D-glucosamine 2-epimerase family)